MFLVLIIHLLDLDLLNGEQEIMQMLFQKRNPTLMRIEVKLRLICLNIFMVMSKKTMALMHQKKYILFIHESTNNYIDIYSCSCLNSLSWWNIWSIPSWTTSFWNSIYYLITIS